ncbi:hypothetical protein [Nannocystis pusilla]|uniref:hypothetical protein n=1 Tax=Nannocystis pusilla TaxID=889268 RepID=UPI003B7923EC
MPKKNSTVAGVLRYDEAEHLIQRAGGMERQGARARGRPPGDSGGAVVGRRSLDLRRRPLLAPTIDRSGGLSPKATNDQQSFIIAL